MAIDYSYSIANPGTGGAAVWSMTHNNNSGISDDFRKQDSNQDSDLPTRLANMDNSRKCYKKDLFKEFKEKLNLDLPRQDMKMLTEIFLESDGTIDFIDNVKNSKHENISKIFGSKSTSEINDLICKIIDVQKEIEELEEIDSPMKVVSGMFGVGSTFASITGGIEVAEALGVASVAGSLTCVAIVPIAIGVGAYYLCRNIQKQYDPTQEMLEKKNAELAELCAELYKQE